MTPAPAADSRRPAAPRRAVPPVPDPASCRAVPASTAVLLAAVADPARLEAAVTAVLRLRGLDARMGRDGSLLYLLDGRPVVRVVRRPDAGEDRSAVEITSRRPQLDPVDVGARAAVALGFDTDRLDPDQVVLRPPVDPDAGWVRRLPPVRPTGS